MKKQERSCFFTLLLVSIHLLTCTSAVQAQNASETRRLSIGFENQLIELKIPTPMLKNSEASWVSSATPEIAGAYLAPIPEPAQWIENEYRPEKLAEKPGQMDNIPQKRQFPDPFDEAMSRRQAAIDFLKRRPDILVFVRDNLGETDPIKVLERWVYEIMQSSDSDWPEAKKILEEMN
ncbi:MAG: hypothetical protein KKB51_14320 [Candidatus Riflebacteria bacterium]|nr:hypothetical protein [Candidatus Riflebacteria bacterium]